MNDFIYGDLILEDIKNGNSYQEFISALETFPVLNNDKRFLKNVLAYDGRLLECVDAADQDNPELVLAAVNSRRDKKIFNTALQYASLRLRNDKKIVLEAVATNGFALQYASEYLRDDLDVVMTAVNNYGQALQWASDRLRKDKDIVAAAIANDSDAAKYQIKIFED